MHCKGIILDLDGTLADTLRDITNSVNVVLAEMGLPPQPIDSIRQYVGDGLPTLCRRALPPSYHHRIAEMAARVAQEYRVHDLDHTRLYDGIPALLDGLVARGLPLAVLSNKPEEATRRMVGALCGRWPFVAVEGFRDDEHRKPDPRTALDIAARMGASPAAVWMVGDSQADVATARAAGMVAVAATWGFRDRDVLVAAGPDFLIDRPTDLLALLPGEPS